MNIYLFQLKPQSADERSLHKYHETLSTFLPINESVG